MLSLLKKLFSMPSIEDMYERGKDVVDEALHQGDVMGHREADTVTMLFNQSSGGFNTTENEKTFDKGIQDRLTELGYYLEDHC